MTLKNISHPAAVRRIKQKKINWSSAMKGKMMSSSDKILMQSEDVSTVLYYTESVRPHKAHKLFPIDKIKIHYIKLKNCFICQWLLYNLVETGNNIWLSIISKLVKWKNQFLLYFMDSIPDIMQLLFVSLYRPGSGKLHCIALDCTQLCNSKRPNTRGSFL